MEVASRPWKAPSVSCTCRTSQDSTEARRVLLEPGKISGLLGIPGGRIGSIVPIIFEPSHCSSQGLEATLVGVCWCRAHDIYKVHLCFLVRQCECLREPRPLLAASGLAHPEATNNLFLELVSLGTSGWTWVRATRPPYPKPPPGTPSHDPR